MARTDTLGNFLTDVAEAIRTKEGTTETIPASEFDTRIANLSGGGSTGGDTSNALYKPRFISFCDYRGSELDAELASLDTSELTRTNGMFKSCIGLKTIDLSNHNLSSVTSMNEFCKSCTKLKKINLPKLYKVSTFYEAFCYCNGLTSIDLSDAGRDTVITNIDSMFRDCNYLTSVNMDNFNASGVTQPTTLFYGCYTLTSLDLSTMKLGTITSINTMFYNCRALKHLDIRNFDFTSVTNTNNAFYNVPTDCEIIVADDTQKQWFATKFSTLTNVKTVAEYEA